MQWGRAIGVAGPLVAAAVTACPPAALAAPETSPAAVRLAPFSTPLQRYTVAQPAYAGPGPVAGPRPVWGLSPLAAAAGASTAFSPPAAPGPSVRGTLGAGLGLGLNILTYIPGTLATVLAPGTTGLSLTPILAPVQMLGFGLGYGVAGDGMRGVVVGLIGTGLVTLAPLVGHAMGTFVPRVPDKPALFSDDAPHHGRTYGSSAFVLTHILVSACIAVDTYMTGLRVDREAEAQRYSLRPPLAPGEALPPARP